MCKTRHGFVSNSSSSSFIVIGTGTRCLEEMPKIDETLLVGTFGEVEFGWEQQKYSDMHDRINFAYLQTQCARNADTGAAWLSMLDEVLSRTFDVKRIEYMLCEWCSDNLKKSDYGMCREGYIDHASSACEGENIEMFDDADALERFLFCIDSYIQGDNDNH